MPRNLQGVPVIDGEEEYFLKDCRIEFALKFRGTLSSNKYQYMFLAV